MANIETSMSFTSTTQGGDKLQKAITDINPDAAGDKLVGFAQKLNALTTNTYTGATKIVKQELSSVAKTDPGLTWVNNTTESTYTATNVKNDNLDCFTIKLTSDARPYIKSNSSGLPATCVYHKYFNEYEVIFGFDAGSWQDSFAEADGFYKTKADATATPPVHWGGNGDIVIAVDETDTYAAAEIVLHVVIPV